MKFNFYNWLWLLLIAVNFQAFSQTEATNCGKAKLHNVSELCNIKNHHVSAGQTEYWIQFTATSTKVQLNTSLSGVAPVISSIDLLSGSCTNLQLLETDSTFSIGDSTVFDASLTVGQTYYLKMNLLSNYDSYFDACLIEKTTYTMELFVIDSNGDTIYICNGIHFALPGAGTNGWNCDPVTVCINDSFCLAFQMANASNSAIDSTFFIQQVSNLDISGSLNPEATSYCLTFNEVGVVTFFIHPEYPGMGNPWPPDHPYNSPYYFSFNVIDQTPPATPNQASTICLGGAYTLTTFPGTVLTNVTLDNVSQPIPDPAFWSTTLPGGQHIINYTVDGLCQPATYSDTIIIIDTTDVSMTIDACNHASFTFQTCDVFTTLEFSDGLGNLIPITPVNGFATWTVDYSNITTPVTWMFNGWQQIQAAPLQYGIVFTESQTISPAVPSPITTNAPSHLCDLTAAGISITGPTGLQNIVWSTSPVTATFTGQGTTTIFPNSWSVTAGNVNVVVTAVDSNGCHYSDTMVLQVCCAPDVDGNEFFERTYVSNAQMQSINNQLPAGYYNGPIIPISINLPAPQPLANQISTSYANPTYLSAFMVSNPGLFGTGNMTTSNWVFFNNDFIIDVDMTILNCDFIRVAPGKRILINPGKTLNLFNSTVAAKCDSMWGGVHIPDPTSTFYSRNSNLISAVKAVHSENGGYYKVLSSKLIDNYASIWVENYATLPTTSIAESNYFGDVINQNLMAPYNTEAQPVYGVYIGKIKDIVVGPQVSTTTGNLFHNHKKGIFSSFSTVHAYRNTFFNIKRTTGTASGQDYVAIMALGNIFSSYTLEVGSTTTQRNNFLNCETGIISNSNMNLTAKYNYMKGCQLRGISAENNRAKTILISHNEINSTISNAWGIYVKNYALGTATIDFNQINTNNVGLMNITRFAAGIYVASVNPASIQTTLVSLNTINNCLYGIWMINTTAGQIKNNQININMTNAQINNAATNYAPIRGIVVQNSQKADVWSNTIERNMGTGNGVANDNLQAIRLEVSPSSYVWKNTMNKTAVGFYALGSSLGSRVECNNMNFTNNGFWMQAADISDQGAAPAGGNPGISAHNIWNNNFANHSDGTTINHFLPSPSLKYYHLSGFIFNSQPTLNLATQYFWEDIAITANMISTCGPGAIQQPIVLLNSAQNRTRELSSIIGGNQLYDSLDLEMKHYLNQATLSRLKHDSTLVFLNAPDDYLYQNYILEMDTTDFSKSLKIRDFMMVDQFDSVAMKLNAFNSLDLKMQLIKQVETIWNNSQLNNLPIEYSDSMLLLDIACLDPLINGSAVYQARAIIDWDGFCSQNVNKSAQFFSDEYNNNINSSTIYPNPSIGAFKVESTEMMQSITIYDLKGLKLVELAVDARSIEIVSKLNIGLYILKVSFDNGHIETHRISIQ